MGNFHISLLFYPYILPLLGKLVFAEYYTIFVKYQSSAKYDRKPPPPTARRLSAPPPTKGGFYKNLVPGFWVSFVERLTKRSVFCIIGALPIRRVVRVVEGAALEIFFAKRKPKRRKPFNHAGFGHSIVSKTIPVLTGILIQLNIALISVCRVNIYGEVSKWS